jgi:hypothetical protein
VTASRRPAAYLRSMHGDTASLTRQQHAIAEGARQRGWPDPVIYAEEIEAGAEDAAPVLRKLEAAVTAGRHDALLITDPGAIAGTARHLMGLLRRCTRHGVSVGFLVPASMAAGTAPPARPEPPIRLHDEDWNVLARASFDALSELYPQWRIWLDRNGWHARRRGDYMQGYRVGAPAFHVSAESAADLAAQLCWQQAADLHAPGGCESRSLPPPWAGAARPAQAAG